MPEQRDAGVSVDDIPVAHTPHGGWHGAMPDLVLAGCTDPLVGGAPDLRGIWRVVTTRVNGVDAPEHPTIGSVQRIEQAGDRPVVTGGGIIHDMRCDGTEEHGVHDVFEGDHETPITVVASYEDGMHVLRPVGLPGIEVTRRTDGEVMIWVYLGHESTLERTGAPSRRPAPPTHPSLSDPFPRRHHGPADRRDRRTQA